MTQPDEYNGVPTLWAEVGEVRVHCLVGGDAGSPVVLLHGGGIDSADFTYGYAIGPLTEEHRVFAPDWPGYGRSDNPDVAYTMSFFVDFLGRLMDTLGLERASLVGLSMGGGSGLRAACARPGREAGPGR